MMVGQRDFEVGIIGGGPAGSAMGAYLARSGVRCVIIEAANFPRAHVGESLVPATTRVFKELGFLPEMERLGFVRKYGASWTSSSGKTRPYKVDFQGLADDCHAAIHFSERAQEGVDQNYTYHVDRARFDLALLQHAEAAGATVYQGMRVSGVDFGTGDVDPLLRLKVGRRIAKLKVGVVLDASGRGTLLGRQLGLKTSDPIFDQFALHSWYRGYDRASLAEPNNIHIHFLPQRGSWVWQIPISDELTSIGVVTQKRHFAAARKAGDAFFAEALASRPDLRRLIERAERVRPVVQEADYSYGMTQVAGPRYLLLGDAARFVDPIFSSGVSVALNSARLAHKDLMPALEHGRLGRASFEIYEATMRRGVRNWYDFICLYYRLNVLFTHFVNHPAHRLDMLKLLQGDVFDEQRPAVLAEMQAKVQQVQDNASHPWHGLLDDLTASAPADGSGALADGSGAAP